MLTVAIPYWSLGFAKVSCTQLLRDKCGLSLSEAKNVTDAILRREVPQVTVASLSDARALIAELGALGASARIPEQVGYDPTTRTLDALASVSSALTPEILQTCKSLAEHGEWEKSISTAQFHIAQGRYAMNADDLAAFVDVSIEVGCAGKEYPIVSTKSEA